MTERKEKLLVESEAKAETEQTEKTVMETNATLMLPPEPKKEETETEKKPRKTRKKAAEPITVEETTEKPKPTKKSTRVTPYSVISIDDSRSVQTEADKAKNDLIDLTESLKTDKILTGTVQGVERGYDGQYDSAAVVYHGVFKVIIPAEDMVEPPEDYRGQDPEDAFHYLLTKRLGAEVDFIVNRIFYDECIAYASRIDAMKEKRKKYYFGGERNGNLIDAGVNAEARVVSVIRAGIFVDLFGVETYIPLRELSYQRMMDAASSFQSGQRILVKVLEVDRSDKNNIQVKASVKQAMENPYTKALRRYTVGNRYVGSVSMVDTNGVFVALDGGIDCLCSYPKRGRPPRGARVTARILGLNHEANRIFGAITQKAKQR